MRTYQLACSQGDTHAIVVPNVTIGLLERFLGDYLAWWRSLPLPAARRAAPVGAAREPGAGPPCWPVTPAA